MRANYREDALKDEISVLSKLNHPNLLHLYATLESDPTKVHLITDLAPGRSLAQHLRKMRLGTPYHEEQCKKIIR